MKILGIIYAISGSCFCVFLFLASTVRETRNGVMRGKSYRRFFRTTGFRFCTWAIYFDKRL